MSVMEDLSKVSDNHIAVAIGALSLVAPGIGFLVFYLSSFFISLDIFKLILSCLVFGVLTVLPFFFTLLVYVFASDGTKASKDIGIAAFILAAIICAIISISLQLITWFSSFDLKTYIILHAIIFLFLLPIAFYTFVGKNAEVKS